MRRRTMMKLIGAGVGCAWAGFPYVVRGAAAPRLRVAAFRFATEVEPGAPTHGRTDAVVREVAGPMKTTVMLFEDGPERLCLIASDLRVEMKNVSRYLRTQAGALLGIAPSRVLCFTSHCHSIPRLAEKEVRDVDCYDLPDSELPEVRMLPVGERFVAALKEHLARLPAALEPVTVQWAQGRERRITYNRKGRWADGSAYFMREEDRGRVGLDYNGDIEDRVPVVVFRGLTGRPVAALLQFTGHPVTSYHPEKFLVFGDYPSVAADELGRALGDARAPVPVGFLQGCGGDTNSKEMFAGVDRAIAFGQMLGQSAAAALNTLTASRRDGLSYVEQTVPIPLAPLPPREVLLAEREEMTAFIRRAKAGDEDTRLCVGQNFPRALSPDYRATLVGMLLRWNEWALKQMESGRERQVMRSLEVTLSVVRLGDVGIVGMPFEPFLGIGRRICAQASAPFVIPCGYMNGAHGYITDGPNTGDQEYMSSFYRYTHYRPPFAKPAGDVVADRAVEILRGFFDKH